MPEPTFLHASGLALDEVSGTVVRGHLDLGPEHHTPWGIVHGGVYCTAVETAASAGASAAVADQGMFAVGLTNTTQFLRSMSEGRVDLVAVPVHQGRSHQLWEVDLRDGAGRLVARGELRLQNMQATGA
jgi:uncharacterized protein (TIGR00369 family)